MIVYVLEWQAEFEDTVLGVYASSEERAVARDRYSCRKEDYGPFKNNGSFQEYALEVGKDLYPEA